MFKTRQVDFTQGSVLKNMLIFTIPVFFANVFSSLYSIVDATVVGRFVGAEALAAVLLLTLSGRVDLMTPANLLLLELIWAVPGLMLSEWIR